ncbi:MAG: di-heme oxidoredictase family protein, partial [Cyanobacteriota bacterium]
TLAEAILWHGGEAASAREAFKNMPEGDRAALLKFLNSR